MMPPPPPSKESLRQSQYPPMDWGSDGEDTAEIDKKLKSETELKLGIKSENGSTIDTTNEFSTNEWEESFSVFGDDIDLDDYEALLRLDEDEAAAQPAGLPVEALRALGHVLEIGDDWSEGRLTAAARDGALLKAAANPRGMQAYAIGR